MLKSADAIVSLTFSCVYSKLEEITGCKGTGARMRENREASYTSRSRRCIGGVQLYNATGKPGRRSCIMIP